VAKKAALVGNFPPGAAAFPWQYLSTNDPYSFINPLATFRSTVQYKRHVCGESINILIFLLLRQALQLHYFENLAL